MTSSLRGLAACTALLILLGLGWVLGLGAPTVPSSPRLWAGRPESVQSIRWLREGPQGGEHVGARVGQQELMVARREGTGWVAVPAGAGRAFPAKARVLDDLLDVLAAARWHRRQPAGRAGAVHLRVVLATERGELVIGLGEALGAQRWLVVSERALLVDAWVARVLEQATSELLDLAALPDAARAPTLEIHGSGGAPWRSEALVVQGAWRVSPSRARLDEALARALRDQLSALQLVPTAAPAGEVGAPLWSIRVAGGPQGEATVVGVAGGSGGSGGSDGSGGASVAAGSGVAACPGGVRVTSSRLGAGCLSEPAVRSLAALVDRAASAAGADARPLAAAPADVVEWSVATASGPADRVRLSRRGAGGWDGERGAAGFAVEPAAAEALLALLTSPWRSSEALPRTPALLTLTARHRDGTTISLSLHQGPGPGLVAVRAGEPLALLSPAAAGGLELAPRALAASLASLSVWSFEPTAVSRVALGAQLLHRGEVIGEWLDARGRLLPAARAAALEELLAGLSSLRALARQPAPPAASRHRLILWIDERAYDQRRAQAPPATAQHTLELSLTRGECAGRADGEGVVVSPELCAQLAALVP